MTAPKTTQTRTSRRKTKPRRHPEIELAIIDRLESYGGTLPTWQIWVPLPFLSKDIFEALDRLEAVGAIAYRDRKTITLTRYM